MAKRSTPRSAKSIATDWPEHVKRDKNFESYAYRLTEHQKLLTKKGRFTSRQALEAVIGSNSELNGKVIAWLRKELATVRKLEKKPGSIVRLRRATSRLEIADIAITMMEGTAGNVEDNLLCLLQELLNVDRHRTYLAEKFSPKRERAALFDAHNSSEGKPAMGTRPLARMLAVSPSMIAEWRKSPDYLDRVKNHEQVLELRKNLSQK